LERSAFRRLFQPPVARFFKAVVIVRVAIPATGGLFIVEPSRQRTVAALLATASAAATASSTASSATPLSTLFVAACSRRGGTRIAAFARLRLRPFAHGPGGRGAFVGVVTMRPHRLAILLLRRLRGRSTAAKREFILFSVAAARRRFDRGPRRLGCRWLRPRIM
jgi:hypothetical protein